MMTPSPSPAEVEALRHLLQTKETEHAALVEERQEKRDEVRSLERLVQRVEAQVTTLREILADADPDAAGRRVAVIGPAGLRGDGEVASNLAGLPRVQAIEIILSEAGPKELHRQEIFEQLRNRGFPGEQLGDTSAALAYLKRTGRVVNPARGYWRAA